MHSRSISSGASLLLGPVQLHSLAARSSGGTGSHEITTTTTYTATAILGGAVSPSGMHHRQSTVAFERPVTLRTCMR